MITIFVPLTSASTFTLTDEYETFTTPVAAATTFLLSLAGNRTQATFLPILGFINSILGAHGPPEQRFGALNMTAALGRQIMTHPEVKAKMEQFMLQYVSPELESPEPFLRAIVSIFSFFRFLWAVGHLVLLLPFCWTAADADHHSYRLSKSWAQ